MNKQGFFKHESLQDRRSIKKYLKAVTDGVSKGTLSLSDDTNDLTLSPDGLIRLNVEVRGERDRRELNITLDWKEDRPEETDDSGALVISAE